MIKYLQLIRVHQYIKNGFVLLPVFFASQMLNTQIVVTALIGFFAFCFLSSVVYIINDIKDVEADRKHDTKRLRPIANNTVSVRTACILACVLLIVSTVLNFFAKGDDVLAWVYILVYLIINLAYSFGLKKIPLVDITILTSGFLLRLLYGARISGIEISHWLYLTVIAMSFYLAIGKRRNELMTQQDSARKVLQYYNVSFLDKSIYLCMGLMIVFYSLWSVNPVMLAKTTGSFMIWTVPALIIICFRRMWRLNGARGRPFKIALL